MDNTSKNQSYLPKNNVTSQVRDYAKIRSWNSKNQAITHDGLKVERKQFIQCNGYGQVECLPTMLHFVYEDKSGKLGRWVHMCTCGSISGIISWNELGSVMDIKGKTGYALACVAGVTAKQNTGVFKHADGSTE